MASDLYTLNLSPKERRRFQEMQQIEGIDEEVAPLRLLTQMAIAGRAPALRIINLIGGLLRAVELQHDMKPRPCKRITSQPNSGPPQTQTARKQRFWAFSRRTSTTSP